MSDEQAAAARPPRKRRPSLESALRQAKAAGVPVRGAVLGPDKIELTFGEPGATATNPWDAEIEKLSKQ
jgi:hypothetical protein